MTKMPDTAVARIETEILLEGIFRRWGYDFRNYARGSLMRRLSRRAELSGMRRLSEMLPRLLYDEDFFNLLLQDMSVTVTEMFRDPPYYRALRERIVPVLRTYPFVKIWHAGCATGEEVYSTAILLKEEGLYDRAQIYATDYNRRSLDAAREGIYPVERIRDYTDNYNALGGRGSLSDYYRAKYDSAKMCESLKENVTFAYHNLITDGVFGEMHLNVCRNVLIYFDKTLQNRHADLSRTLEQLSGKANEFATVVEGYSSSIEGTLTEADMRARNEIERVRATATAQSERTLEDLRDRLSTVSTAMTSELGNITNRFTSTSEEGFS